MSPLSTAPAALTAGDRERRAAYLEEVLGVLYPDTRATARGGAGAVAAYALVPHARRPVLLVPLASRRIAAAAVRRYAEPGSTLARLKREAVVAALRTGADTVLLPDRLTVTGDPATTIDGYLRGALGTDLHLSVHLGPARANRKPVLQLLTPAGDTVAYAKLGTGPLTRALVRDEAAALTALSRAPLAGLRVPRVLHHGVWNGHEVLVQSALPVWLPRAPLAAGRLAAAMRELAHAGPVTAGPLGASAYWRELRGRLAPLAGTADGRALTDAAAALAARHADRTLRYGGWHGDWAPWNMASLADTLLVWDWERYRTGVPVGFDAVHHALQERVAATTDAAAALRRTLDRVDALLAPFDVPPPDREPTALLYLVDLAARYLADRQAEAGARLGVLGTWLLPVLVDRVAGR
ncbi:hypothetical protein GCM10010124_03860 [Pilimelia terevasa]|uniref:Aminoglycoside phosphotransferase domain-containing protein n=1 Tax=Pilimelia terevasa TaxID=53372 RepID=A0A8J3BIZ8_9ACTN|nr:hypothetical protein [Pilimelia terevasa]GGK14552.1 hypothetical protein GCM10010124_03860 [Pilimelia terevasa]